MLWRMTSLKKSFFREGYNDYTWSRHCLFVANQSNKSEGITPDTPPPLVRFFLEKKGGYLEQKFFIRDFLTKKFSGASRRRKIRGGYLERGGVSGVIPSDLIFFVFEHNIKNCLRTLNIFLTNLLRRGFVSFISQFSLSGAGGHSSNSHLVITSK